MGKQPIRTKIVAMPLVVAKHFYSNNYAHEHIKIHAQQQFFCNNFTYNLCKNRHSPIFLDNGDTTDLLGDTFVN